MDSIDRFMNVFYWVIGFAMGISGVIAELACVWNGFSLTTGTVALVVVMLGGSMMRISELERRLHALIESSPN